MRRGFLKNTIFLGVFYFFIEQPIAEVTIGFVNRFDGFLGIRIVESIVTGKIHGNISIYSNSSGTKVSFDYKN